MSDSISNNPNLENQDDEFKQFAAQVAADDAARKTGGYAAEFEEIKWSGLEKAKEGIRKTKVIRALGGTPNTNKTPFDARTVKIAQIVCDDKKTRRFILPSLDDNKSYLIWRLINNVLSVVWDKDKKKSYVHEATQPIIFQMVENNSFPIGSMQQKTTYGWSGRDMFIMNCLDREQMAWHRSNKHSMLLSKEIRQWTAPDGKTLEFAEQGVPSYGFVQLIASDLFSYYGDWKNYDIGIERTGAMQSPYKLFNCEKNPEKISKDAQKTVVIGPLTKEEKEWEMYDLRKLFGVSSYTKWWNNLKNNIATIDTALGTHYHSELKSLMEAEKKEREEKRAANVTVDDTEKEEAPVPEAPIAGTQEHRAPSQPNNQPQVHCIDKLPQELRDQIDSFSFNARGELIVVYKSKVSLLGCTVCATPAPKDWTMCPKCGVSF